VSPRPYRLGERRAAVQRTRTSIVAAARKLLTSKRGVTEFSVDAVAEEAGVARMTVYYQFKSKSGLLEALIDDVGNRAEMRRVREVFEESSLERAVDKLAAIYGNLYTRNRLLIRRLQGLSALDADVERAMSERNSWRRELLERLLLRSARDGRIVDVLHMLTSFETYDALAGKDRSPSEVAPEIAHLARIVLKNDKEI
jgi:AcrR family transcriptional regulator